MQKKSLMRLSGWGLFLALLALGLSACPKKQVKKTDLEKPEAAEVVDEDVDSQELDIRNKDFQESKNLEAVHFEYDSSELSAAARQALSANSAYLKKLQDIEILVEGHCDARGTIGYNLALGQKRAQVIRKYYISLGLPANKIGSLSFGKEKPVCEEMTEECWSQNRRAVTKIRSLKTADNGKPKPETPQ